MEEKGENTDTATGVSAEVKTAQDEDVDYFYCGVEAVKRVKSLKQQNHLIKFISGLGII